MTLFLCHSIPSIITTINNKWGNCNLENSGDNLNAFYESPIVWEVVWNLDVTAYIKRY